MTKTRVILVNAPYKDVIFSPWLGLGYLGAVLEKFGCEVKIVDGCAPYASSDMDKFVNRIEDFNPDIIGVTITLWLAKNSYHLMKKLKKLDIPIIAGGPHVTLQPDEVLNNGADIICIGEGEETFPEIIEYVKGKKSIKDIQGISYKDRNSSFIHNESRPLISSLDILPYPAKHLFGYENYVRKDSEKNRFGNMITSRGCPNACTYCASKTFGRKIRYRTPENIVGEMKYLKEHFGVSHIEFIDDAMTVNQNQMLSLCQVIKESKLGISWSCITRIDCVTPELLKNIREAGCVMVNYGIESGNDHTLRRIRKGFKSEQIKKVLQWTKNVDINCDVNFMTGFPWENQYEMRITTRLVKEIRPFVNRISLGILTPMPKTELYEEYKNKYSFENWWLDDSDKEIQNLSSPFFAKILRHYMILKYDFFQYTKQQKKEIKYLAKIVARHNLIRLCKRVSNKASIYLLIREMVWFILKVSRILYLVSPYLEMIIMRHLKGLRKKYEGIK